MSTTITVAGVTTPVITHQDRRVCTTQQLAEFYGCTEKNLSDNFAYQRGRFEEGKHFIKLEGAVLRAFRECPENSGSQISPMVRNLILWTEKGAARHAKMLTTEKAWEVFEQLEDAYFRVKEIRQSQSEPMATLPDFTDPATAAIAWAEQYRAKTVAEAQATALSHEVAAQVPKVEFHDQVVQSDQLLELGEAAKILGTGRNRLCRWMRENHWLNRHNEPYQEKIEAGLLDLKYSKTWTHPEKGETRSITTMVTGKGLARLHKVFAANKATSGPVFTRQPPPLLQH